MTDRPAGRLAPGRAGKRGAAMTRVVRRVLAAITGAGIAASTAIIGAAATGALSAVTERYAPGG